MILSFLDIDLPNNHVKDMVRILSRQSHGNSYITAPSVEGDIFRRLRTFSSALPGELESKQCGVNAADQLARGSKHSCPGKPSQSAPCSGRTDAVRTVN